MRFKGYGAFHSFLNCQFNKWHKRQAQGLKWCILKKSKRHQPQMARTFKDQRKFIAKQMIRTSLPYCVAKMNNQGQWESLERFASYDDADNRIDYWCDRYPFAFVDIISIGELNKVAA